MMQRLKHTIRNSMMYIAAIVLFGSAPMSVFAQEATTENVPKPKKTYTYDPATKRWNSDAWVYDSSAKAYVAPPQPVSPVQNNPQPAQTSPTGTSSSTGTNDTSTQIKNDVEVQNSVQSDAESGKADVTSNTSAGSAKTGDATAETTIINSVHSTLGGETAGVAHFTADIYGNVVGDITIGPAIKKATSSSQNSTNTTNVTNSTGLTNDVTLNAKTGDATVSGNTKAGSATSGDAHAVANVLNLINTIIAANQSFVGTINIYGNLNGDILISPEFIPQLIASNADAVTTVQVPQDVNINDDQSIINNVKLDAVTGDATVASNTKAGSAKTGTATTNLTILNLTGHAVDASNSLLVFVNVLGKWVGIIVDAPGATAAAIGSGVSTSNLANISSVANFDNTSSITNNIDLSALSGDASVTKNTEAGNATTGNATASANIANISTSVFNISDWFGVLFINVYGTWIGSFGIDTEAGTIFPLKNIQKNNQPRSASASTTPNLQFSFRPSISPAQNQLAVSKNNHSADEQHAAPAIVDSNESTGGFAESHIVPPLLLSLVVSLAMLGAYLTRLGIQYVSLP